MSKPKILGFRTAPQRTARGKVYRGRFTCHDVQWTGGAADALATFTVTAGELADAAENRLLWTDQDVQRGIQPGLSPMPDRELPVGDGYPNPKLYVFDSDKADDIAEKLLRGELLFLSPLVWNLRPGKFDAFWSEKTAEIFLYGGKIFLPDSHHRQQALLKAVRLYRDSPSAFTHFSPSKEFKVELYFLSRNDEGNYFFDKNQRPKPTAKSKAYDLTTLDDLSLLAKRMIEKSSALQENVNRVTDRLTARNPQVVTLSTLREMLRSIAPDESLDEPEIEGLATVAATFYDLLAEVRHELGRLEPADRRQVRGRLVVDSAVMMHGYGALIQDFNDAIAVAGSRKATREWRTTLQKLSPDRQYSLGKWRGDFFEKQNPLWQRVGVTNPGRDGRKLTVLNTGGARLECRRVLRQFLSAAGGSRNIAFLASK